MANAAPPAANRLDRMLTRAGVDPRKYRALMAAYLLLDFRNQQFGRSTGCRRREGDSLAAVHGDGTESVHRSVYGGGALRPR